MNITAKYWNLLKGLVITSEIVIDRPKGTSHPRYPEQIYPLDYGYLKNTHSSDGDPVDIWLGSMNNKRISGIVCTVDAKDRDVEIKLLLGCTSEDIAVIVDIHNQGTQAAFFIPQ